jgi:hypothetical protein
MNRSIVLLALSIGTIVVTSSDARAGLVYYSSQSSFESEGTILSRVNLDSYGTGEAVIGYGTTMGGIVFETSPYAVSLGTANGSYSTVQNVAISPEFASVVFGVESSPTQYNLLGFQLGTVLGSSDAQVFVTTNLGGYSFTVSAPYTGNSLAFEGFVTTSPSEYITGFQVYSAPSNGGGAAVTDFELGTSVPEPGSLTLLATAGLLIVLGRHAVRRRRANGGTR